MNIDVALVLEVYCFNKAIGFAICGLLQVTLLHAEEYDVISIYGLFVD